VQVQLAAPPHHHSLVDLLCELHAYYNEGHLVARELVQSYLVEHLLAADSPLRLAVACEGPAQVIGFAAISLTYSLVEPAPELRRQCWLKELYVCSGQRSRGAGRALMSWVARYAVDNGCARIDWPVNAHNPRGLAFYESLGARRVAERVSYRLAGSELHTLAGDRLQPGREGPPPARR